MFRLMGVHPGPQITASAAAALAGTSAHEALGLLTELAGTHMLMEHLPDRYAFHDLLRAYAAERAHTEDSTTERHMAIGRVLDYYLHTAHAADHLLYTDRETLALDPPPADAMPDHLADERCAQTWLTTEHTVLLRIILKAEEMRFDTHAWQLPVCISRFLDLRGHWDDWAATGQVALRAARRLGDTAAQARIHLILAYACMRLDARDAVRINLGDALKLYRKLGDRAGQARIHLAYCKMLQREANYRDGFGHAQQALILYWSAGERAGQAIALDLLGWAHAHLRRPELALACCRLALSLHRQASNRMGEAGTWDSLGYAHHQAGQYHRAVACYRRAITGFHEFAAEFEEACSLVRLGDTYFNLGRIRQARDAWEEALSTFEEVKHQYTSRVRSRLQQLDSATHVGVKCTKKLASPPSFEPIDTV